MAKYMNILLQRSESTIPWGFKIRGENGNGIPFVVVHRVTPGTIASNYLQPGDVIIKLSQHLAKDLINNEDIEDVIRQAGNSLELIVCKRPAGSLSPSSPLAVSPIPQGVTNSSPKRFTPTSPIPPGAAQDYTSPGIPTPPPPPYPTHISSPTPYTPPPPPPSFSPLASPRTSMVLSPSSPIVAECSFPPPPPLLPPLTTIPSNANTLGPSAPCPAPPPPPPPLPSGDQLSVPWRVRKMNVEPKHTGGAAPRVEQYDKLPAALQSTMLKDKKPFTYTPGGIDLSELRSPRMQRRIHVNQLDPPRNLAKSPLAAPTPPAAPDMGPQVTSPPPPPPETYPQTRVQLLPSAQGQPMASPSRSKPAVQSPQQQPSQNVPTYAPQHYNSPMQIYSTDNVAEAYENQTGDALPGFERKAVNAKNDNNSPRRSSDGGDGFTPYYRGQQAQSRSFRLLQVMTDTTSDAREDGSESPKTPTPILFQDEMKFTGLRRNPIPSRAFQTLQRITGEENGHAAHHPPVSSAASQENPDTAETELRYRGAYIPSRSFRILQEMTGERDEDVMATRSTTLPRTATKKTAILNMQIGGSSDADSLSSNSASPVQRVPPSEQKAEAEPKKYTGACIPSKSFRMLQAMTGSDDSLDSAPDSYYTSPVASSNSENAQPEGGPRMYMGGKIPSRSFRLLQAMTDPDRADGGSKRPAF